MTEQRTSNPLVKPNVLRQWARDLAILLESYGRFTERDQCLAIAEWITARSADETSACTCPKEYLQRGWSIECPIHGEQK